MVKPIEPMKLKVVLDNLARSIHLEENRKAKAANELAAKLEKRLKAV
jgi:hypothetical protein